MVQFIPNITPEPLTDKVILITGSWTLCSNTNINTYRPRRIKRNRG